MRTPDRAGYSFAEQTAPRPLVYLDGPARIAATPYFIGRDAQRFGVHDQSIVGSAEMRARSNAYLLLHLWAILASLPIGVTEASIAFAGGLPVEDYSNRAVGEIVKNRLKGTHRLRWGEVDYRIAIEKILLVPQPIGALATLLMTSDGRMRTNGDLNRTRLILDIGGGTSYSMLKTLDEAYKVLNLQGQRYHPLRSFYQMTLGNARALSMEDKIGTLAAGTEADFIVLDARATSAMKLRMETVTTLSEELFLLQTMGDDRAVAQTYVAGVVQKSKAAG